MKRFSFPLQQLLTWRRLQFELEQTKLDRLLAEQAHLNSLEGALGRQQAEEKNRLGNSQFTTGTETSALAEWLRHAGRERTKLVQSQQAVSAAIAQQRRVAVEAQRKFEVLAQHRDQQKAVWLKEIDVEQESLVAELVVSRWKSGARR